MNNVRCCEMLKICTPSEYAVVDLTENPGGLVLTISDGNGDIAFNGRCSDSNFQTELELAVNSFVGICGYELNNKLKKLKQNGVNFPYATFMCDIKEDWSMVIGDYDTGIGDWSSRTLDELLHFYHYDCNPNNPTDRVKAVAYIALKAAELESPELVVKRDAQYQILRGAYNKQNRKA
ncbi:MAG: hypothetical protein K5869_03915 [Saccharofermentans sp.]|nr:hypothetical protein [Saccharofermentans sp.]